MSFRIKITKSFLCLLICSHPILYVLNPLFVDVSLIASSNTLLYFDMGPFPESSKTRLLKPFLLNLNISDLCSKTYFCDDNKHSIHVHLS